MIMDKKLVVNVELSNWKSLSEEQKEAICDDIASSMNGDKNKNQESTMDWDSEWWVMKHYRRFINTGK